MGPETEMRKPFNEGCDRPSLGAIEKARDTGLRRMTLKERLEQRRTRLINQLGETDAMIEALKNNPDLEAFHEFMLKAQII